MKTKYVNIIIIFTLLGRAFALDPGILETEIIPPQETKSEIPFVFSFIDNANPAINPFAELTANFHLTLISGRVGSVNGLQIGGVINRVKYDFTGYDATGIISEIGGKYSGFQTTGIYNRVEGSFIGIQNTGIYSFSGSDFLGIQSTGITNKVEGSFEGLQIAGIC